MFCGWTLKRGVFFWAPYYFAVTRHSELLWYEGGEAELKLAGTADLLLIKRTLTPTLTRTRTLARHGRPPTDQANPNPNPHPNPNPSPNPSPNQARPTSS